MTYLKELYSKHIKCKNIDEALIFIALVSQFLPYVFSGLVAAVVSIRALVLSLAKKDALKSVDGKLILAFFVINLLSPFFHKNYLGVACFFGVSLILIFAVYAKKHMTVELFSKIANAISFMSICTALVAVIQKYTLYNRAPSVFFNPNYYGAVIIFVVLMCVYRLITRDGSRIFAIVTICANFVGLLMADCQSAFFSIALGVWLILLFTKKYKLLIPITVLGVVGVICLPYLTFIMPRITNAVENITIRSGIWNAGINEFLKVPFFGRGMMGYLQIYKIYGSQYNFHCHNLIIDMLLSFGVIGNIPLVWFVLKNLFSFKGKKYTPLILALVGAVLLHGLVDVTVAWIQTGIILAFFLSCSNIKKENC